MPRSRARQWADLLADTPVALDANNRLTVGDAATASATLDVATNSGAASVEIQAPNTESSLLKFGDTDSADIGQIKYDHASDYMSFTTNGSEKMRMHSGGSLTIGTTTDNALITAYADSNSTNNRALYLQITDDICDQTIFGAYIDYNISGSDATTTNQTHVGLRIDTDSSATGGTTTNDHRIYSIYNTLDLTGDSDIAYGMYNGVRSSLSTADTTTSLYGIYNLVQGDNTAGTISNEVGTYNLAYSDGTVTNLKGEASIAVIQEGAAITSSYGVHSEVQIASGSSSTTMYGVRSTIDENGGTSTNSYLYYGDYQGTPGGSGYGLYITGETDNYLSGDLTVAGSITAGSYRPGEIIETIACMCDGSTVSVLSGDYTITNCSAAQSSTASYVVMTGSQIDYTPPAGTKRVLYRYNFKWDCTGYSGISHFKFQIDGTDVVPASRQYSSNYASTNWHHANLELGIEWVIDCDAASNDAANGKFTSWTSAKTLRGLHRHYGGGYAHRLHGNVWWDGTGASGGYNNPIKPFLYIQAIA